MCSHVHPKEALIEGPSVEDEGCGVTQYLLQREMLGD
jgi:hypothetical protein